MCKVIYVVLAVICISCGLSQNISNKAKLIDPEAYFINVLQSAVYDVEELGFCNLKLQELTKNLTVTLYDWNIKGIVKYSNGFVTSIQAIEITDISNVILSTKSDIRGTLSLRDVTVGYDVIANLGDDGEHRFTGMYKHAYIDLLFGITKDLKLGTFSVYSSVESVSAGSGVRMVYMPENNISEVLSREFDPASSFNSAQSWARNIFTPAILERAQQTPYPEICFNC